MASVWKGLKRILLFGVLPLLVIGGTVAWVERETLLHCWYLHQLAKAEDDAPRWADRLAGLGERVVPDVLALLAHNDARACANAGAVLTCLAGRWEHDDPRRIELMNQAVKEFHRLSPPGQAVILNLAVAWAEPVACSKCLACTCGRLLAEVNHLARPDLHGPAVELTLALLGRSHEANLRCAGRDLARLALHSPDATTRVRALKLATLPGIDLRKDAVPLLSDPQPLVRRAAMLAIGEASDAIQTDNLLPWLHDPDPEVRKLCESALCGEKRRLKPEYLRLAKLITDPRWQVRVSVLDHLDDAEELDAGAWLRRLSHDVSPAVRAAAIRAACAAPAVDLTDRLDQMARDDPSATVSELARHFLEQRR